MSATPESNLPGIRNNAVIEWLSQRVPLRSPIQIDPIPGGHSNLTYRITDGGGKRYVLRRPPLHSVLATAHDMQREYRIVNALASSEVPVPPLVDFCANPDVTGAPFYVMHFVEGIVARRRAIAELVPEANRTRLCKRLIEVLAAIHRIEPDTVGLGDLGKKEQYIARQLSRWIRQVTTMSFRPFPALHDVHAELAARIPEQRTYSLVHGDYRLDNCIATKTGNIAAVLDWELCTLGDPRADLGILLAYWVEPQDTLHPLQSPPTTAAQYATRCELATWYSEVTGEPIERLELQYFYAFANWRLACILEGVYARYRTSAMGRLPKTIDHFPKAAEALVNRAQDALAGSTGL